MEQQRIVTAAKDLVSQDFEVDFGEEYLSEEQLLDALAHHIEYMLESRMETLMSTLYRLDVSERKVAAVLLPDFPQPAHIGLAQLIIDRQKQRIRTKHEYRSKGEVKDWLDF